MVGIDFDFVRYVNIRKGQVEQRERDGAAYAYSGERKVRRALTSARPVIIAIEATTRLWKSKARRELLARSTVASDAGHAPLYRAARAAGESLGLQVPGIYVADASFPAPAATLGTDEDTVVVVNRRIADRLGHEELVALVGHELGHVQNNHVRYSTALFYLRHEAMFFVRWIVQPAIMALKGWARRAEVTCDRAALIATRDIEATLGAMVKAELDGHAGEDAGNIDVRAHLAELAASRGAVGRATDLFRSHPFLPKRAGALEVFAQSVLYHRLTGQADAGGMSADEVDAQVSSIMSVFA